MNEQAACYYVVTQALWYHLRIVKMSYVDVCTSAVWWWWIKTVGLELTCCRVMPAIVWFCIWVGAAWASVLLVFRPWWGNRWTIRIPTLTFITARWSWAVSIPTGRILSEKRILELFTLSVLLCPWTQYYSCWGLDHKVFWVSIVW